MKEQTMKQQTVRKSVLSITIIIAAALASGSAVLADSHPQNRIKAESRVINVPNGKGHSHDETRGTRFITGRRETLSTTASVRVSVPSVADRQVNLRIAKNGGQLGRPINNRGGQLG
jgi:hypothetical protein